MRMTVLLQLILLTALSGCASASRPAPTRQPLLGDGHGIDHVTILTSDLAAAADEYTRRLGFTVGNPTPHSFGFTGAYIDFADGTFIELYAIHDREKVAAAGESFALEAPEGIRWVTLHSGSTADTTQLLTQRGIAAWGPYTLPEDAAPDAWSHRLSGPEEPVFPGGRLFFVEYNEARRAARRAADTDGARAREAHANGAIGLRSVWVTVRDLSAAAATYESAGLIPGPEIRLQVLDTNAREIRTPGGTILLVQSRAGSDDSDHDSFSGISIRTENLERVRTLITRSHALTLEPYQGLYGRSILVPSTLARGASIEFFE